MMVHPQLRGKSLKVHSRNQSAGFSCWIQLPNTADKGSRPHLFAALVTPC